MPLHYAAPWMYDGQRAFASQPTHLHGVRPTVLQLKLTEVTLPLAPIAGPLSLGAPAQPRIFNTFNPSIARAPRSLRQLCQRCAYVVALRVDPLHQCNATSPLLQPTPNHKPIATGAWFKGTAFAVLDVSLKLVAWTWLLPRPEDQVSIAHNGSRWFVAPGAHGGYDTPPWGKPAYDTRLLLLDDEELFATTNCKACTFMVAKLEVTALAAADGGLRELRVWAPYRVRSFSRWMQGRNQALFAGPSDASLVHDGLTVRAAVPDGAAAPSALLIQPWLGLVASMGVPRFRTSTVHRCYPQQAQWWAQTSLEERIRQVGKPRAVRLFGTSTCGPTPIGAPLNASVLLPRQWATGRALDPAFDDVRSSGRKITRRLLRAQRRLQGGVGAASNATTGGERAAAELNASMPRDAPRRVPRTINGHPIVFGNTELLINHTALERRRATFDVGGSRVSPTANLIRIRRTTPNGAPCQALLGIGHTHRGTGHLERRLLRLDPSRRADYSAGIPGGVMRRRGKRMGRGGGRVSGRGGRGRRLQSHVSPAMNPTSPFLFGYRYTHFWYTMQAAPPYRMLATSAEFCIGSAQDASDCESVQFVSGLAHYPPGQEADQLLLSFGINDCEAKVAHMPLAHVWAMLRPLAGESGACE